MENTTIYNGHLIDNVLSNEKEINGKLYKLPSPYDKLFHFLCKKDKGIAYAKNDCNPCVDFGDQYETAAQKQGLKFIFFLEPNTPKFAEWLTTLDMDNVALLEDTNGHLLVNYCECSHDCFEWINFNFYDMVQWSMDLYFDDEDFEYLLENDPNTALASWLLSSEAATQSDELDDRLADYLYKYDPDLDFDTHSHLVGCDVRTDEDGSVGWHNINGKNYYGSYKQYAKLLFEDIDKAYDYLISLLPKRTN